MKRIDTSLPVVALGVNVDRFQGKTARRVSTLELRQSALTLGGLGRLRRDETSVCQRLERRRDATGLAFDTFGVNAALKFPSVRLWVLPRFSLEETDLFNVLVKGFSQLCCKRTRKLTVFFLDYFFNVDLIYEQDVCDNGKM